MIYNDDFEECPKCNESLEADYDEDLDREVLWCPSCGWEEE